MPLSVAGYRRLRAGSYRVLYEVEADVVIIVRVGKVP
jgi:mRNA-degrading endonuclease RelE of RelBE toxin-antitoxin system